MKSIAWPLVFVAVVAARLLAAQAPGEPAAASKSAAAPDRADDVQDMIVWTDTRPLLVRLHITVDGKPFRQAGRDYLNRLFDELDRDKDGVLNKDEAMRAPLTLGSSPFVFRQPVRPQDLLAAKAADADGKVSRDAFLAHYERSDAAPFSTAAGQGRPSLGIAAMELLDTNHDHALGADELRAAESSLRRRDFDDDETVTDSELAPGQGAYGRAAFLVDAASAGRAPTALVTTIEPSTDRSTTAAAIVSRYDANKDGRLSAGAADGAEVRFNDQLAAALDTSDDGVLDRDELVRFVDRRPDIELRFAIGTAAAPEASAQGAQPGDAPPVEFPIKNLPDGRTLVDAGETQLEFRQGPPTYGPAVRQTAQAQFRAFDPDNNGYIDETESRRIAFIGASFQAMDRDGDGKVFKEEFEAFMERQVAAAATRLTLTVSDEGRQLFELLDKNHDGRLTIRELRGASELMAESDADFDGVLGGVEIPRRLRFDLVRGSAAQLAGSFVVAAGMRGQAPRGAAPTAGPVWFRKMDHNRDGDLSPREFLGPLAEFTQLDTDHDGLITPREADAAGPDR
jgi:Ca2+-binding EF-hand superfamily protein